MSTKIIERENATYIIEDEDVPVHNIVNSADTFSIVPEGFNFLTQRDWGDNILTPVEKSSSSF